MLFQPEEIQALCFSVDSKHFGNNKLFENDGITIIMRLIDPYPQVCTQTFLLPVIAAFSNLSSFHLSLFLFPFNPLMPNSDL